MSGTLCLDLLVNAVRNTAPQCTPTTTTSTPLRTSFLPSTTTTTTTTTIDSGDSLQIILRFIARRSSKSRWFCYHPRGADAAAFRGQGVWQRLLEKTPDKCNFFVWQDLWEDGKGSGGQEEKGRRYAATRRKIKSRGYVACFGWIDVIQGVCSLCCDGLRRLRV